MPTTSRGDQRPIGMMPRDDHPNQQGVEMALSRRTSHAKHKDSLAVPRHDPDADLVLAVDRLPDRGLELDVADERISSELLLDGNARLNLATFVTTWMPSIAARLMAETADKNMIDKDEYRQTAAIEARCVNIIAKLWECPEDPEATGCSTTGSSEAVMLGGMALKWRWRARRKAAGLSSDRPELVRGTNVHVCWQKFCRYWDVEPRMVPMTREHMSLDGPRVTALCDENTIGVVAVLGSTEDGRYDPVAEIAADLDNLADERGVDVPLHIDAASGGFVAPFLQPA